MLTDLQLPGSLDGRSLVARARAAGHDLPVIYASGRLDGAALDARREMAIAKPYHNAEIRGAIRKLLAA